ncbi:MAG: hypothetical protein ACYDEF_07310 [Methanosarcina sp.]
MEDVLAFVELINNSRTRPGNSGTINVYNTLISCLNFVKSMSFALGEFASNPCAFYSCFFCVVMEILGET